MRTQKQWLEYKKLELIPLEPIEEKWLSRHQNSFDLQLAHWLEQIWLSLGKVFEVSSEPQVWKTYDFKGNPIWHTHDPMTGESGDWISEEDVRIWLEERYNQAATKPWLSPLEER